MLEANRILFFCFLLLISLLVFLVNNRFVLTRELYYNTYIESLSAERIDQLFEEGKKWNFLTVLLIPLWLIIKISFPAICLFVGLTLKGMAGSFGQLFNIALKAELIFTLANMTRCAVLTLSSGMDSMTDLNYYPLSLLSITGSRVDPVWLAYPLQSLNLFELVYWLTLAGGLTISLQQGFDRMLRLVLGTYVTGFAMWILLVVLFTMTLT